MRMLAQTVRLEIPRSRGTRMGSRNGRIRKRLVLMRSMIVFFRFESKCLIKIRNAVLVLVSAQQAPFSECGTGHRLGFMTILGVSSVQPGPLRINRVRSSFAFCDESQPQETEVPEDEILESGIRELR